MLYPFRARHVLAIGLVASAMLAAAPFMAHATTIFSDLGPEDTYGSQYYTVGDGFTPLFSIGNTTAVVISQFDVALTPLSAPGGVVSAEGWRLTSSGAVTEIGSYAFTPTGSGLITVLIPAVSQFTLLPGDFFALQSSNGEFEFNVNTQGVTGPAYDIEGIVNPAGTEPDVSLGTVPSAAFALFGTVTPPITQVPEPRSVTLFGAGLAGLAWLRRRKAAWAPRWRYSEWCRSTARFRDVSAAA
jgi:hypothetical protein